jgi:pyridoxine 5-phosphate synthase
MGTPARRSARGAMTRLSVNVNKIAVLRNARGGAVPDIVHAAHTCLLAGAHGITVHPRPDARHVRADDVDALAALTRERGVEFNLEGNPFAPPRAGYPGFLALCERARPAQATLVPDGDAQLTSDHGFDFARDADALRPLVAGLKAMGCRVSLFADAGGAVERAAEIGADRIELYTGPYAEAHARGAACAALDTFADTARRAQAAGLGVNAGHDLDQRNLGEFLAAVPDVLEVSIGHALVSEALYAGFASTVRAYLAIVQRAGPIPSRTPDPAAHPCARM